MCLCVCVLLGIPNPILLGVHNFRPAKPTMKCLPEGGIFLWFYAKETLGVTTLGLLLFFFSFEWYITRTDTQ